MDFTETNIQKSLFHYLLNKGHQYVIPNIYFSHEESDILSVTRNNYYYEFEIKVTLSDFKADFKKFKHKRFNNGFTSLISRFTYVAPINAIPLCIPWYAGLIEVYKNKYDRLLFSEVKQAPKLPSRKMDELKFYKRISKTLMWRYWNTK